jgi:hypothetical protein
MATNCFGRPNSKTASRSVLTSTPSSSRSHKPVISPQFHTSLSESTVGSSNVKVAVPVVPSRDRVSETLGTTFSAASSSRQATLAVGGSGIPGSSMAQRQAGIRRAPTSDLVGNSAASAEATTARKVASIMLSFCIPATSRGGSHYASAFVLKAQPDRRLSLFVSCSRARLLVVLCVCSLRKESSENLAKRTRSSHLPNAFGAICPVCHVTPQRSAPQDVTQPPRMSRARGGTGREGGGSSATHPGPRPRSTGGRPGGRGAAHTNVKRTKTLARDFGAAVATACWSCGTS